MGSGFCGRSKYECRDYGDDGGDDFRRIGRRERSEEVVEKGAGAWVGTESRGRRRGG